MRPLAFVLLAFVSLACGGKASTTCPAGDICTPMPEGGTTPPGGAGATAISTEIQATATNLVSDGTSVYWTSSLGSGGPVYSAPVSGGAVSTVVAGPVPGGFLAVDDVNVYYPGQSGGYYSSPKGGGGSATLVTPAGAEVVAFTLFGGNAYWMEDSGAVKTAPAQGGATTVLASLAQQGPSPFHGIAVTSNTVFVTVGGISGTLAYFPITSGVPAGSTPATISGLGSAGCMFLVSDTTDVYCSNGASMIAIADDGTTTTLGTVLDQGVGAGAGSVAADDTYVYWVDEDTVGTIMRSPKSGGSATIIARDTSPVAIAVDDSAIYWSDVGGNIMRLPK